MTETLSIETDARGVAAMALIQAEKHNAMNAQMMSELTDTAAQLGIVTRRCVWWFWQVKARVFRSAGYASR